MAQNNTLIILTPFNSEIGTNSPYAVIGMRNGHPVLLFDDSSDESINFTAVLPNQYSGNGITIYIHYAMDSAVTGTVEWAAAIERIGDQALDIDNDSFATEQTNSETVPGTSGYVSIIGISFNDGAEMDALSPGEAFRLKITRDASIDTAIGDAQLLAIEIREN